MPLHVLIVGAGLAGLCCAISLGRQGHKVDIYEKSSFSLEIGAAYHTGPYVMHIFKEWGFDMSPMRAVVVKSWEDRDCDDPSKILRTVFDLEAKKKEYGLDEDQNEIMHHRVDAHRAFREAALAMPNVKLHLAAGAVSADVEKGILKLVNGEEISGDVIIGADGIHSRLIKSVDPSIEEQYPTGVNMYRFMVEAAKAKADADTAKLLETMDWPNRHVGYVHAPTRRMFVLYSCRDGTLLNCATFQLAKDDLLSLPAGDYNSPGSLDEVLHIMEGWPPAFQKLAKMAEDIKHWAVINRDVPDTYAKGRLAMIGDAAHPTAPSHAAGANMGIEDAAVLGVVLDSTTASKDVVERLQLYNRLRYQRTTTVKYVSEIRDTKNLQGDSSGAEVRLEAKIPGAKIPADVLKYLWTHDAVAEAKQAMSQLGLAN